MHNGNTRRKREKGTEEIFEAIMTENFPKHDRHQMRDPGSLKKMVGMQNVQPLWKTAWRFLKKLKIKLLYEPAIALLGI